MKGSLTARVGVLAQLDHYISDLPFLQRRAPCVHKKQSAMPFVDADALSFKVIPRVCGQRRLNAG